MENIKLILIQDKWQKEKVILSFDLAKKVQLSHQNFKMLPCPSRVSWHHSENASKLKMPDKKHNT